MGGNGMYCRFCGSEIKDGAKFCPYCGKAAVQSAGAKKRRLSGGAVAAIVAASLVLILAAGWLIHSLVKGNPRGGQLPSLDKSAVSSSAQTAGSSQPSSGSQEPAETVQALTRPQLLHFSAGSGDAAAAPSVAPYAAEPGLANVTNAAQFSLSDEAARLLEQNLFVVMPSQYSEFFERYEDNRYFQTPNFVTVDSLMHTYHLYFSLLLSRTEKNYLSSDLLQLSKAMLQSSLEQYRRLKGTEWEEAALRNTAFFAVAASLQDKTVPVPDEAAALVSQELSAVYAAEGVGTSGLTENYIDYSQFKPRGYYAGDEVLEPYFRAMMWYGQINFPQKSESLTRSALLMTLAMHGAGFSAWEKIYAVTSFFAGESDDLGYYEYEPAIEAAYGGLPDTAALAGSDAAYQRFVRLIEKMSAPAVNSVPVPDRTENVAETVKGFRFMGQRFTIDAAILQQLIYSSVKENSAGNKRMLPDTLDVPAALGSDEALALLTKQGDTDYSGYTDHMQALRGTLAAMPADFWSSSLYSSWLYTLEPLLTARGEGYPSFMTGEEWLKKDLETYAGSYTELKHDTVLYAKQAMAEMGGGPEEVIDDRGYVEPETEVYSRFLQLAQQTGDGLNSFGLIGSEDLENLSHLAELAQSLLTISQKELANQTLTDDEYELIRSYGGTLEHFWEEAVKDKSDSPYLDAKEIPAALVTDIATDPNGSVLQIATGQPAEILVIVPVDGQLRLASGSVYDFYQFQQPISDRLTDAEWRQKIGQWADAYGNYNWDSHVEKPWWTQSYRGER